MTINKSILEEVELENGSTFYIQYSGMDQTSATISFDGPVSNYSISIKSAEVDKIMEAIKKGSRRKECRLVQK